MTRRASSRNGRPMGGQHVGRSGVAKTEPAGLGKGALELGFGSRADLAAPDPSLELLVRGVQHHSGHDGVGNGRVDPGSVGVGVQEHTREDESVMAERRGVGPERREVRAVQLLLVCAGQWPHPVQLVAVQGDVGEASCSQLGGDLVGKRALPDARGSGHEQEEVVRHGHGVPSDGRPASVAQSNVVRGAWAGSRFIAPPLLTRRCAGPMVPIPCSCIRRCRGGR